jgi:hypothetical protein
MKECKQYVDIVDQSCNAIKTVVCTTSGLADENGILFIHCTLCGGVVPRLVKELDYFVRFNSPSFPLFTCIQCSNRVNDIVGSDAVQEQRASCLFASSDYWGVIGFDSAQKVKTAFQKAGKCGFFLWEVQSLIPFDSLDRVLVVAVTHVKYASPHFPVESSNLDKCTYYIVFKNGLYHITKRIREGVRFLAPYGVQTSYGTLREAIDASQRRRSTDCGYEIVGRRYCRCSQISRSSVLDKDEKVKSNVWRLQDMCAFLIRNYSFHFQKECFAQLPFGLKEIVSNVRSVNLLRA